MMSCCLSATSLSIPFPWPQPRKRKEKEKIGKVNRPQGQWLTFPFPFLFLLFSYARSLDGHSESWPPFSNSRHRSKENGETIPRKEKRTRDLKDTNLISVLFSFSCGSKRESREKWCRVVCQRHLSRFHFLGHSQGKERKRKRLERLTDLRVSG